MIPRCVAPTIAALALAGCATVAGAPGGVHAEAFGRTAKGQPVERFSFANATGMRVSAISYGATLTAVDVPGRAGQRANIVLSLPDIAAYERTQRRWASVIGRYAGRIADARFTLDGVTYGLEPGRNGVTLHGGSDGYDRRVWAATPFRDAGSSGVIFRLDSRDGDQGFPGHLQLEVTYRIPHRSNELHVEYRARSDAPTVLNPTNHGFFNLAGAGTSLIGDHRVMIAADRYAETDERKIPTGRLLPVTGTALDLQQPTLLAPWLDAHDPLLAPSNGFDHSLVLSPVSGTRLAATVDEPASGRRLEIFTTEPSVQFNSGNGFDGTETGSEGIAYSRHAGFAIETQHLPDSPNQPGFPSTMLRPGQAFRSLTIYRFSVLPTR